MDMAGEARVWAEQRLVVRSRQLARSGEAALRARLAKAQAAVAALNDRGRGKRLSLTPMYLAREDHATGLIRLLTIRLRVLTLLEFAVRCRLAAIGTQLAGLYAGNPKRTTAQPTAERLLEAFQELTLTIIRQSPHQHNHLTALSAVHRRIIALPELAMDIYIRLYDILTNHPKNERTIGTKDRPRQLQLPSSRLRTNQFSL